MRGRTVLLTLVTAASAAVIGVGAALGVDAGAPQPIDPDSLDLPPSIERRPWVRSDGTINEARVPPTREDWRRDDGRVDCSTAPETMSIATFDGRILLDGAGREVRMPALTGCRADETPELVRAWIIRATALQEADARRRGIAVPAPPETVVGPELPLPPGGIAQEGETP